MTTFQIIIRKFWIYVEKPIWSFIVNCVFWIGHLNKIGAVRRMKTEALKIPLESLMYGYIWKEDSFADWTPWASTILYNALSDDCDGAAALAKWWFKQNGVEAEILNLYSSTEGHAICVTKDRMRMVTNERVVHLFPETWEDDILRYFGNKYEVII